MPRQARQAVPARAEGIGDVRRRRRERIAAGIIAALFPQHFRQAAELGNCLVEISERFAEELDGGVRGCLVEQLQADDSLLNPLGALGRIGNLLQLHGIEMVGAGQLSVIRAGGERNVGNRRNQRPLRIVPVQPRELRDRRGVPFIIRPGMDVVPIRFGQLADQAKPVPQPRKAVQPDERLDQPRGDPQVLGMVRQGVRRQLEDHFPVRRIAPGLRLARRDGLGLFSLGPPRRLTGVLDLEVGGAQGRIFLELHPRRLLGRDRFEQPLKIQRIRRGHPEYLLDNRS